LDQLDTHHIEADELTLHTPDLDDVFFALTTPTTTPDQTGTNHPKENVR
ncbi:ABC transporter, partial [Streptomyces sp. NPDC091377]